VSRMTPERRRELNRKREEEEAEFIRTTHYEISARSPAPPKWLATDEPPSSPGVPCAVLSDIHYGETVSKDETGGVNSYNCKIAAQRLQTWAETVINISMTHMGRSRAGYPGIVCALGGDMVSGSIHEEIALTEDRTVIQQVLDLEGLLISAIKLLKKEFGRVFLPCVVGNHGRSTIKPRNKGRVHSSFNFMLYCLLERYFQSDDAVQFLIPNEADAHFSIYGHRFLLTHGDSLGVRGGDGIIGSIGPIMRGALKIGRSESTIGRDFDTLILGHWHQYLTLPGVVVNGAVKGFDEYARLHLRAPYERPTQALFFVHPEHQITARWPVYLEPLPRSMQTTTVVAWTAPLATQRKEETAT
jgi:hypothetical protein